MSSGEDNSYGPQLPPSFSRSPGAGGEKGKEDCSQDNDSDEEDAYIPTLPPHLLKSTGKEKNVGYKQSKVDTTEPRISHEEEKQHEREKELSDSDSEGDMYGPALPPHMLVPKKETPSDVSSSRSSGRKMVGPMLPRGYVPPATVQGKIEMDQEEEEEEEEEEEGDPMIGPALPTHRFDQEQYRVDQFELRAKRMREQLEGKNTGKKETVVRESWMLELPEDKPNFCGLGPRKFLRQTPQEKGDRSGWTDTPADKARKAQMQLQEEVKSPETVASTKRDQELKELVDQYNSNKRAKPLVDIHKKKMKVKKESGPKERRPFSREEDLCVNKFDDAQRQTILKKARQLNDRFSSGGHKFL